MKNLIKKYKEKTSDEKRIIRALITICIGAVWSLALIVFSIISQSIFIFVSALFSISLYVSNLLCLIGFKKNDEESHKFYIILSSLLMIAGGIFYCVYSVRLLFGESPRNFGLIISLAIALFSFISIVNSSIALVRDRKNPNIYIRNIKIVSFISALTSIMLTQMSLLMIKAPNVDQRYNFYFALAISIFACFIGLVVLIKDIKSYRQNS